MPLTRRAMTFGLIGSGLGLACKAETGTRVAGGHAFGSTWRITTASETDPETVRADIETILTDIDSAMSPYRETSALSEFNATRTTDWQPMPLALCRVARAALDIAGLTGGAFDPTVGPIVSRLGFGPIKGGTGSHSAISVRADALRKSVPDLTLDFCGIAKGHALDRIVQALSRAGIANALVEIGGEVRVLGQHPQGRAWNVAISDPWLSGFQAHRIVQPGVLALATSGHIVNGLHVPLTASHIIDPHLGRAASTALASVSVLAPTAMQADALATALCAVGPEAGIALARRLSVAALFATETGDIMTGHFARNVLI